MKKKSLMVLEDFHQKDIKVGDRVPRFEGSYEILDMNYSNEHGEFILCEYIPGDDFGDVDVTPDFEAYGMPAKPLNPYEILGTISVPGYRNLMAGIGFFIKNTQTGVTEGVSFQEAFDRIFNEGAINATASKSRTGVFHSKLIDSTDELPSFDSHFWKIPAYFPTGELFAPLTKRAEYELKKGLKIAVRSLSQDVGSQFRYKKEISSESIRELKRLIQKSEKITVLTGAGISTLSGVPDYRSSVMGMWEKNPAILEQLNERTFQDSPEKFWSAVYKLLETTLTGVMPFQNHESLLAALDGIPTNSAHRFLKKLEKEFGKDVTVITQNVDGLHQSTGNERVIEFHGNIRQCICPRCDTIFNLTDVLKKVENKVSAPTCRCGTVLRPNVVFFEDAVKDLNSSRKAVEGSDLLLVVGTSLQVYPFNQLPYFKKKEAKVVYLNGEVEGNREEQFDLTIEGDILNAFWQLEKSLESQKGTH
ncbi:SIR2 family NAD-dependent protein deacylase [Evansella tamaricis]|uniref:protein acetyllysine N-acetyltransferase n=1 Tax=Evansella tamaricis TaxID=2069301 RepID=A0ABS6JJ42_9BACI|nr:Sir2 family NAD-dependent protein deacetylase [Evansella tamaricis]MBU9713667.1 hypothetical protein [Evansella tamaricis]